MILPFDCSHREEYEFAKISFRRGLVKKLKYAKKNIKLKGPPLGEKFSKKFLDKIVPYPCRPYHNPNPSPKYLVLVQTVKLE
jgi:hypothetical protein